VAAGIAVTLIVAAAVAYPFTLLGGLVGPGWLGAPVFLAVILAAPPWLGARMRAPNAVRAPTPACSEARRLVA